MDILTIFCNPLAGPPFDHTRLSPDGKYMYVDAKNAESGKKASNLQISSRICTKICLSDFRRGCSLPLSSLQKLGRVKNASSSFGIISTATTRGNFPYLNSK